MDGEYHPVSGVFFNSLLNQGVIDQPAYVALVLMSLVTTLVVPILLRNWLYRT